ncbi:MAG TPA: Mrp/NBP35 family ATP-binding protein [Clostridia bacterium]|nr:Mrp/NBP35 family ATP-binding protein [Clostridia bacterium]
MSENSNACGVQNCKRTSCEGCDKRAAHARPAIEPANEYSSIRKVIGVMSGKGGVGKSLVTAMMAVIMTRAGYKTGIMDADITGPSIPKMFGLNAKAAQSELGIFPVRTHSDIEVMSINLLLDAQDSPVIWRGPILSGVVKQFWTDVLWGDLDFLFIDMPPGTGDIPLTIFQSIPLDGIIIVTTPQELVSMIVKKAYNMAKAMNIPILGLVENMSYVVCPDCGREINVFGPGRNAQAAAEMGIDVLAKIPINPSIAELSDKGEIERIDVDYLNHAAQIIKNKLGIN